MMNRRHPTYRFVETRILEVTTNFHQSKQGIEVRLNSLSDDGSHSWVRISKDLNKFVRDLTEKARIPSNNAENEYDNLLCKKRDASVLLESKHTNLHQRRSQNLLVHLLRRILQRIFRFIKEIGGMWNQNNIRGRILRVSQFQRR